MFGDLEFSMLSYLFDDMNGCNLELVNLAMFLVITFD